MEKAREWAEHAYKIPPGNNLKNTKTCCEELLELIAARL